MTDFIAVVTIFIVFVVVMLGIAINPYHQPQIEEEEIQTMSEQEYDSLPVCQDLMEI